MSSYFPTSVRFAPGVVLTLFIPLWILCSAPGPSSFTFAILGDRTGETIPGVYEEVWREISEEHPDFVINVGDTIQGGDDLTADAEWRSVFQELSPFRRIPLFLIPGNHDVWSLGSAQCFEKYAKHPLHYSFDYRQTHFTILDNSRSDQLLTEELAFLKRDLELHPRQSPKFVFMHRPSWIMPVVLQNPEFPLNAIVQHYQVKYVIAGHIHQMLHFELDGVQFLSMGSSGGHLREAKDYEHGWFFQHTLVRVNGSSVQFQIKEADPPFGKGRVTKLRDWGVAGLNSR